MRPPEERQTDLGCLTIHSMAGGKGGQGKKSDSTREAHRFFPERGRAPIAVGFGRNLREEPAAIPFSASGPHRSARPRDDPDPARASQGEECARICPTAGSAGHDGLYRGSRVEWNTRRSLNLRIVSDTALGGVFLAG